MTTQQAIAKAARKVLLPLSPRRKRLPLYYWTLGLENALEAELRHIAKISQTCIAGFRLADGAAVDVGANIGLFSYRMSQLFAKVYAFEVNNALTRDLLAYNPGNIEVIHKGLSSELGSATLYIPFFNGQALTGWGSLSPGNCPSVDEHVTKPVEVRPLDSFKLPEISFVKIDVEGHEVEVLKGALGTLTRDRPTVLVEVKDCNREEVAAYFDRLGYSETKLRDLAGVDGEEENCIYTPRPSFCSHRATASEA